MLTVKKLGKYWWILGLMDGDEEYGPVGPYNSKKEANESRKNLIEFDKNKDKPGFLTSEKIGYD
jgi:hypothetical protein